MKRVHVEVGDHVYDRNQTVHAIGDDHVYDRNQTVHAIGDVWRRSGAFAKKGDDIELACERGRIIQAGLWEDKVTQAPVTCVYCIGSVVSTA